MATSSSSSGAFDAVMFQLYLVACSSSSMRAFDAIMFQLYRMAYSYRSSGAFDAVMFQYYLMASSSNTADELDLADYFPKAIEEAIKSSSLHIAIFSEHYAQSPWCLAELFCMLQTPSKFMPIFYHVDPSDLRWAIEGKGIYKGAFSDYVEKKRYPSELQRWKQALQQASLFTGDIIKKENQG
ncbi:hypothetical protein SUGI_0680110 [Cryptomeria japonica]|nr:hypothetical protein SUGI_0680110 [Cryptomeria japonica]